jgi:hypothetical protein
MKPSSYTAGARLLITGIILFLLVVIAALANRHAIQKRNQATATSPTYSILDYSQYTSQTPGGSTTPTPSSPTPTPSSSPAQTTTNLYTNATYGYQAMVPAGFTVVDKVTDSGDQKSDRTVLLTNDPTISSIAPGHCLPGYMFSAITPSTPFSNFAQKDSWNYLDNLTITQSTINSLPTIEISGVQNQQYVSYTPNTKVKISLLNLGSTFLEMTSCAVNSSIDTATYTQIETSLRKK